MKIENLREEKNGKRARVVASVTWEDCDRPKQEVYFETDEAFAEDLTCNPHAFLVGGIIPAMHYGEQRVFIDAEICPALRDGLRTAMGWIRHWYYSPEKELVNIESKKKSSLPSPRKPERAGFFFSGGIDSFATLRANRINFPPGHPWSIKDGLLVYGLEQDIPEIFEYVKEPLSHVAMDVGVTLIPVYTNLYLEYRQEDSRNRWSFWYHEFMGAALAAIAHAFSSRLTVVSIAADYDIPNQRPHGSQPLLDPNYSSVDLRIFHDGINLSRFSKTRLLADWDVALQHLRVCNQYKLYNPGRLNCGKCEKCIRTMLALVALGALDKTAAFPLKDITVQNIDAISLTPSTYPLYKELIIPLHTKGRVDLAEAIEQKLLDFWKMQKRENLKTKIRQIDNKYFGSNLLKAKRRIFQ
jgi:hypothetical protein